MTSKFIYKVIRIKAVFVLIIIIYNSSREEKTFQSLLFDRQAGHQCTLLSIKPLYSQAGLPFMLPLFCSVSKHRHFSFMDEIELNQRRHAGQFSSSLPSLPSCHHYAKRIELLCQLKAQDGPRWCDGYKEQSDTMLFQ